MQCRLEFHTANLPTNFLMEVTEEPLDGSLTSEINPEEGALQRVASVSSIPPLTASPEGSSRSTSPSSLSSLEAEVLISQPSGGEQGLQQTSVSSPPALAKSSKLGQASQASQDSSDQAQLDEEEEQVGYEPTATLAWMVNVAFEANKYVDIVVEVEDHQVHREKIMMGTEGALSQHSRVIPLPGRVFY